MRSEIMGEYEKLVQPTVEKLRTPGLVGMGISLNADAAVAYANTIERLAQELDTVHAENRADRQWLRFTLEGVAIIGLFAIMNWLAN